MFGFFASLLLAGIASYLRWLVGGGKSVRVVWNKEIWVDERMSEKSVKVTPEYVVCSVKVGKLVFWV